LNGDERSEFLLHLRECSACSTLYAMTYRHKNESISACPAEESLSSLAEGKVSENEREVLLKHLAVCKTCSAEFYLLKKIKDSETTIRRDSAKNRNIFRLIAVAAMIALIIGFAGHNTLVRYTSVNNVAVMQEVSEDDFYDSSISALELAAPEPEKALDSVFIAQNQRNEKSAPLATATLPGSKRAEMTAEQMLEQYLSSSHSGVVSNIPSAIITPETQKTEQDAAGSIQLAPTVYEVIYKGHDGDELEIIKLIQSITGKDEESARFVVESSSVVVKECSSIEEAQKTKEKLESIGVKIEIREKFLPD